MTYNIHSNVFFKKINDDQINILLADNDNYIFKLTKTAAHVFLMTIEKKLSKEEILKVLKTQTSKTDQELEIFLDDFYSEMLKQSFFVEE